MYLLKKIFVKKYLCWLAQGEPCVPYETMKELMVGSTSSSINIHGFTENNSNPYRSMIMATMRMKYDYSGEDSRNILLNEEQNVDTTKFFKLLKDYDEPL
jgi:hypothetical protein